MVASPSKIKTVTDIIKVIEKIPEGPVYTNDDTGEHFRLGQVIASPFDVSNYVYDGTTVSHKLNNLLELAEDIIDDDRYLVDFDLRREPSNDYSFIAGALIRHGERV